VKPLIRAGLEVNDGDARPDTVAGVLARERIDSVRAQWDFSNRSAGRRGQDVGHLAES